MYRDIFGTTLTFHEAPSADQIYTFSISNQDRITQMSFEINASNHAKQYQAKAVFMQVDVLFVFTLETKLSFPLF